MRFEVPTNYPPLQSQNGWLSLIRVELHDGFIYYSSDTRPTIFLFVFLNGIIQQLKDGTQISRLVWISQVVRWLTIVCDE